MKFFDMKSKLSVFILLILLSPTLISWGVWGHERINSAAVLALQQPLQSFFYNHIDFITQEASVPDLRKYVLHDRAEGPRHYFDLENFGDFDSLPETIDDAEDKYERDFLNRNGILPWYIMKMMDELTVAFKQKSKSKILFIAADLGHYIADSHMPFHTTVNYNGQLTNQTGIHALWESQLPEFYGKNYNFYSGDAVYIQDIQDEIWSFIKHSNSLVEVALKADKDARTKLGSNVFLLDDNNNPQKNKFGSKIYSPEFVDAFNENLNGMIENQLRASILATSNFWYTAWVNAGKPDLSFLDPDYQTKRNKRLLKKELKLYKKGILINIVSDLDF